MNHVNSTIMSAKITLMSMLKLANLVSCNNFVLIIFGNFDGTGKDKAAPSKKYFDKNIASPGPIKFIARPDTVWSARKFIDAIACKSASKPPEIPAHNNPSHAFPVKYPTVAPASAPMLIMPSIPMFITPHFSDITPPIAASVSGAEYINVIEIAIKILLNIQVLLSF